MHGQDYYFLSKEEFEARRVAGEFLEYAEVHKSGYWYGTLVSEMGRAHSEGKWSLLEVDVQGAMSVMERFPDAITIFLMTPDVQEYEKRLRARGTESEEILQRRLQTARDELKLAGSYRYRVVNDNLDHAVSEICRVLAAEAKHV
jgi:guanylate kinase